MTKTELDRLGWEYGTAETAYKSAKDAHTKLISQLKEVQTIYRTGFCDQGFYQQYKAKSVILRKGAIGEIIKRKAAVHIAYKKWDSARLAYHQSTEDDRLAEELLASFKALPADAKLKFLTYVKEC